MSLGKTHDQDHKSRRSSNRKRLALILLLTCGYMVAEIVGGLATNSLAHARGCRPHVLRRGRVGAEPVCHLDCRATANATVDLRLFNSLSLSTLGSAMSPSRSSRSTLPNTVGQYERTDSSQKPVRSALRDAVSQLQ